MSSGESNGGYSASFSSWVLTASALRESVSEKTGSFSEFINTTTQSLSENIQTSASSLTENLQSQSQSLSENLQTAATSSSRSLSEKLPPWVLDRLSPQPEKDAAAVRIQRMCRGYAGRRYCQKEIAYVYAAILGHAIGKRIPESIKPRARKACIVTQNRRIKQLRTELQAVSYVNFGRRAELEEQLRKSMYNLNHLQRGARLIQAWWRSCLPAVKKRNADRPPAGHIFKGGKPAQSSEPWSVSSLLEKLPYQPFVEDDNCYPRTNVKRYQPEQSDEEKSRSKRILVLFSDTGGGHRASALSLEAAFKATFGEQVVIKCIDVITERGAWPWNNAGEIYRFLADRPFLWETAYKNTASQGPGETNGNRGFGETNVYHLFYQSNRPSLLQFFVEQLQEGLDLVISVHPLLNHIPYQILEEIAADYLPMVPLVTVVTDLGGCHSSWFDPRVAQVYVPSDAIRQLALDHGVPEKKLLQCGLPLRQGFWGRDLVSKEGRQKQFGLPVTTKPEICLVMGGGEGFGALDKLAVAIGNKMVEIGRGHLVVVCGRNKAAFDKLEDHGWPVPDFKPTILGFVDNMDEYMTAVDVIVTKAGPGTIAEAMTKGLPVLLTSFLPGQEEGNVKYVTENGVGQYIPDTQPELVAETLAHWLNHEDLIIQMSKRALCFGRGKATLDIACQIGELLKLEPKSDE